MDMTRVSRRVLMTVAILMLVLGVGTTLALLGCGSDGGGSEMVGPAEDIVVFPGGTDDVKLDAVGGKDNPNRAGIDLGTSGYFHSLSVPEGYTDNHWFVTRSGVSYQVEVISEGANTDVDLYIGRFARPFSDGGWRHSARSYPLMDGIVFKANQDGRMYVDVRGLDDGGGPSSIPYRIHVRKCQFGTFSQ